MLPLVSTSSLTSANFIQEMRFPSDHFRRDILIPADHLPARFYNDRLYPRYPAPPSSSFGLFRSLPNDGVEGFREIRSQKLNGTSSVQEWVNSLRQVMNLSPSRQQCKDVTVVAGCDIPLGTYSPVLHSPLDVYKLMSGFSRTSTVFKVSISNGELFVVQDPQLTWIHNIDLAPNCHVQNVQVVQDSTGAVRLRTTKRIRENEKLFVWFSDEIAKQLDIAFLTPANIRGGQSYVCHFCTQEFQEPNLLKLHLAFICRKNGSTRRLTAFRPVRRLGDTGQAESANRFSPSSSKRTLDLQNSPRKLTRSEKKSCAPGERDHQQLLVRPLPNKFQNNESSGRKRQSGRLEDYKTKKTSGEKHQETSSPAPPPSVFFPAALQYPIFIPSHYQGLLSLVPPRPPSPSGASEPVSPSLEEPELPGPTAAMKRHKCFYCGKLYSRKYGLKIHIRTHTGYKPLKCRVCFRPFGDPSNLNKHVRLHAEGDTPYRCEFCGKVLVRRRDLDRHVKSRHPNQSESMDPLVEIKEELIT